jgi:Abi-like protein
LEFAILFSIFGPIFLKTINNMRFLDYEQFFSQPRMARYLTAAKGDLLLAKRMYRANIAISAAFSPLLSAFEVCLRNQLNQQLALHFGRRDWILRETAGFMSDASLGPAHRMREDITRAERKLRFERRAASGANVLAEQTLGFWVSLFEPSHYRLLRGIPIQAFANMPTRHGRSEVFNALHTIRKFRNRVYHNEPVCFDSGKFDLKLVCAVLKNLQELSIWIDPRFGSWMVGISQVDRLIKRFASLV